MYVWMYYYHAYKVNVLARIFDRFVAYIGLSKNRTSARSLLNIESIIFSK